MKPLMAWLRRDAVRQADRAGAQPDGTWREPASDFAGSIRGVQAGVGATIGPSLWRRATLQAGRETD